MTPEPRGSRRGNRVTALRWAAHLRGLGHRVRLGTELPEGACELLVALHAVRSAPSVLRFRDERPGAPVVVVLTGTDVYREAGTPPAALEALSASLEAADRIVALQALALEELTPGQRGRARVIPQSASAPPGAPPPDPTRFEVCAIGHLRHVKDPLLLARATRLLPARSRVQAVHLGGALDEESRAAAQEESRTNPRWTWLGELPHRATLEQLAQARLLVVTSRNEGGPIVVAEAIAAGVPVLSTRMPAARALLGEDHPGLFAVGDAGELAALLLRAEQDRAFLGELRHRSAERLEDVSPARERGRIAELLAELEPAPEAR